MTIAIEWFKWSDSLEIMFLRETMINYNLSYLLIIYIGAFQESLNNLITLDHNPGFNPAFYHTLNQTRHLKKEHKIMLKPAWSFNPHTCSKTQFWVYHPF